MCTCHTLQSHCQARPHLKIRSVGLLRHSKLLKEDICTWILPFPPLQTLLCCCFQLSALYPLCLIWLPSRLFCLLVSQLHSLQPSELAACMAGCQGICRKTLVYLLPLSVALNSVFVARSSSYHSSSQEKHSWFCISLARTHKQLNNSPFIAHSQSISEQIPE